MRLLRTLPIAAALATGAAFAGTATVNFGDPALHTDAGTNRFQEQENLEALARHLDALARQGLPAGHHLQVDLLDVDLAGNTRPLRRTGEWVRVVRGGVDWPRMRLRYTLSINGQPVKSGEERIDDMSFTRSYAPSRPLYYEKRMLSRWFNEQFAPQATAAAR